MPLKPAQIPGVDGMAPSDEAKRLVQQTKRNTIQVASLAQARMITHQMITRSIGEFGGTELVSIPRLHQMRNHPMLKMGLHYRKAPIMRMRWHIECPGRPDIAQGIDRIVRERWAQYMKIGQTRLDFGFKGAISAYDLGKLDAIYIDPRTGDERRVWRSPNIRPMVLGSPTPIPPEFAQIRLDEDTGRFNGFTHSLPVSTRSYDETWIRPEFALWWMNEFEERDNAWYGFPALAYAWDYWWSAKFRHHMEDRHFEQKADPPLMVSYPEGMDIEVSGRVMSARDVALSMGHDIRGGATIAKPSTVYIDDNDRPTPIPLWDASFLQGGENMSAFTQSNDYLNIMMLRAIMVPEQALVEGIQGTGARATSSVHAGLFEDMLAAEGDYEADFWNRHIIPHIKRANWGDDAPDATMVVTGFQEADLEFLQGLVEGAFNLDPNALPIKFEDVLRALRVPIYSPEEQKEREEELVRQEELNQPPPGVPTPPGVPVPPGMEQMPSGPAPGAGGVVNASGVYYEPRETIHLHSGAPKLPSYLAPSWAQEESYRRQHNIEQLSEDMRELFVRVYEEMFDAAVDSIAGLELAQDERRPRQPQTAQHVAEAAIAAAVATEISPDPTDLGVTGLLLNGMSLAIGRRVARLKPRIQATMAKLYHTGGEAELTRMDLNRSSWDIGRQDVQDWAREKAGDLIVTLSRTVVQRQLRPWLERELPHVAVSGPPGSSSIANLLPPELRPGSPEAREALEQSGSFNLLDLSRKMAVYFEGYPAWMAERVVRSEARMGYNASAARIWKMSGVDYVRLFDGLGGRTGQTDAACLARNGRVVTVEEFLRIDREEEHPNGTLGAVPMLPVDSGPREIAPMMPAMEPVVLVSQLSVDSTGWLYLAATKRRSRIRDIFRQRRAFADS